MTLRIATKSKYHLFLGLLLLTLSVLGFMLNFYDSIPFIIVGVIDLYLMTLLSLAAIRSDDLKTNWDRRWHLQLFPTRTIGLFLFATFFFSIICSFATVYDNHREGFDPAFTTGFEGIYFSGLTLTTLGFEGPECTYLKKVVLFEVFSALNLLIGAFGLLISRFSNFRG